MEAIFTPEAIVVLSAFFTSPLGIGVIVYVIGFLLMLLISLRVLRSRKATLIEDYGYTEKRLYRLWLVSGFLWFISMFYGMKGAWQSMLTRQREARIRQEQAEYEREIDEDGWPENQEG